MGKMTTAEIRTNAKEIAVQKILSNEISEMRVYGNELYLPVSVEKVQIWVRMSLTVPNWKQVGEKEPFNIEEAKEEYEFKKIEAENKRIEKEKKREENLKKREAKKKEKGE